VGILEWIGAHLLGPIAGLVRTIVQRPRPELKLYDLVPTGGGGTNVDFRVDAQNVGTKQARCTVNARVGNTAVEVLTPTIDLLTNNPPTRVHIRIKRPDLGDLVPEFNAETTLYGRELVVELTDGKRTKTLRWSETVYTAADPERYTIQQRVWAIGKGDEVPRDARHEPLRDLWTQITGAPREDLIRWVLEVAARSGTTVPVKVQGRNPAVVTYHPAGTNYLYPDQPSYMSGMQAQKSNPLVSLVGKPPKVVSEWSDDALRAWLRKHHDQSSQDEAN